MTLRPISEIIIHCSATRPNWMHDKRTSQKVSEIRRWHVAKGWSDIGYHYLIDRDGTVAKGRPVERVGAHVKGHNTGTIGVCLIGGHGASADDSFNEHFTPAQAKALDRTIEQLQGRFGVLKVTGHNEYANKGCPGFRVQDYFAKPVIIDEPYSSDPIPTYTPWSDIFDAIMRIFKR